MLECVYYITLGIATMLPTQNKTPLNFVLLLAMTMALGPLAIDTYLPAFPGMAKSLQTSVHQISISIPVYIFMLALGQLIAGPASDRFGRQIIMLLGLIIFAIASFLIAHISNLNELLFLRAIQAFGAGWAAVCVPAMVRDRLSGVEAARFFSLIGLLMVAAPAVAPSIGSLLLNQFGWPSIFLFLSLYAVLLVILLKFLLFNQGHSQAKTHASMSIWARYRSVFAVRPALRFMFLQALSFSIMLLFITHSSFIYQQHFGASSTAFAFLFGANIVFMLLMNLLNRQLLHYKSAKEILRWSLSLQGIGIVLLLLISSSTEDLWLFLPAMVITIGAMGAIMPNIQACYMDFFEQHGGTASALLGATQFSIAGLISAASTLMPETVLSVIVAQAGCSFICLVLIWRR
jgi:DHA1 family bicyclomycin/chloramphenicol resistance-like MFS transporter